jgi:hypothetical protein
MTDFEVRELPANVLTVDPRVQRVLDPRRVQRLAEHWNELMVGVLTVSHRTDPLDPTAESYVVLDGQTRLGAFRHPLVCGPTTSAPVLCQVYEGLQLPEEAAMFLQHNDRKSVRPIDNYRLSLVAARSGPSASMTSPRSTAGTSRARRSPRASNARRAGSPRSVPPSRSTNSTRTP